MNYLCDCSAMCNDEPFVVCLSAKQLGALATFGVDGVASVRRND